MIYLIYVCIKDMKYNHIRSLVEYIYYGEAAVPEDELQGKLIFS